MTEHLSPAELEAYVTGALEGEAAAALEAHAQACPRCAAALAAEAALEVRLHALGEAPAQAIAQAPRLATPRRGPRRRRFVVAALAAAAAVALAVQLRSPPSAPQLAFDDAIARAGDADDPLAALGAVRGPASPDPTLSFDPLTGARR